MIYDLIGMDIVGNICEVSSENLNLRENVGDPCKGFGHASSKKT